MSTTLGTSKAVMGTASACALAALALIVAQFALAGAALFVAPGLWVGTLVAVPLIALLVLTHQRLAGAALAPPSRLLFALYLLQVLLAAASDALGLVMLRALHVGNAALVLSAAWLLAQRAWGLRQGR